jgi:hypothetical protein
MQSSLAFFPPRNRHFGGAATNRSVGFASFHSGWHGYTESADTLDAAGTQGSADVPPVVGQPSVSNRGYNAYVHGRAAEARSSESATIRRTCVCARFVSVFNPTHPPVLSTGLPSRVGVTWISLRRRQ